MIKNNQSILSRLSNKLRIPLVIIVLVTAITGCNNKLNLLAPYKNITVVYGLLDQNDTTHYIRINKAYEGSGNALIMAQQYDSINYPIGTLTVVLQDYDAYGDPPTAIPLKTTMGIPVSPGIFSYPNQVEYYTKAALNVNDTYELEITNNDTHQVVTGSTTLLPDVNLNIPSSQYLELSWYTPSPVTINWYTIPNGAIYQLTIRFYYEEINQSQNDSALKSIDWVFPPQTPPDNNGGDQLFYSYLGDNFLQVLKSLIQPAAAGISRRADSVNIIFSTGSVDFSIYSNLSQPSLGVNQDKPFYTNLKNGIGIFSARHIQSIKKLLSPPAVDSIRSNSLTSDLGFLQ